MTRPRRLEALALDWNGTVVDDRAHAEQSTNRVLARMGMPPVDSATFEGAFTLPLGDFFLALGVRESSLSAAVADWNSAMRTGRPLARPGAERLLSRAYRLHVPVIVISGAELQTVAFDAAALNFTHMLADIVAPAHDKASALIELRRNLGDFIVYVGDTVADIEAAHAARVASVGLAGGYNAEQALRSAGPGQVLRNLSDVLPLLTSLGPPGL